MIQYYHIEIFRNEFQVSKVRISVLKFKINNQIPDLCFSNPKKKSEVLLAVEKFFQNIFQFGKEVIKKICFYTCESKCFVNGN